MGEKIAFFMLSFEGEEKECLPKFGVLNFTLVLFTEKWPD
jgi:hypothetical protein